MNPIERSVDRIRPAWGVIAGGRSFAQFSLLVAQLAICGSLFCYDVHKRAIAGTIGWVSCAGYASYFLLEYRLRNAPALEPRQARFFTATTRFVIFPLCLVAILTTILTFL